MARMYSRKKGKSGSVKPVKKVPVWTQFKEKEVEKLVIKFAKEGKSTSEIGMILRDSYGVASVKASTNKKISKILDDKGLIKELPEDLLNVIRKLIAVKQHFEKNRQDQTSKRGILLANSRLRRLIKYYKNSGRLSKDWSLDMNRLKMYLE